jgi:APA family basic amino acid/polyamine antiporter
MSVFRTKSIEASMASAEEADHKLKRTLSALDLTVFGIGVIIGAGIFTLTGRAAKDYAGPSIALLRRVRVHGPDLRLGLHLLLRHPG